MKAGHKVVDLKGDVNESALVKKVQWDALGMDIVHVDFERVSLTETGSDQGCRRTAWRSSRRESWRRAPLHHPTELDIECPAGSIPERS